jgi:hypothetical protein
VTGKEADRRTAAAADGRPEEEKMGGGGGNRKSQMDGMRRKWGREGGTMTGMNTHTNLGEKARMKKKRTIRTERRRRGVEGIVEIEKGFGNFFGNFPQEIILGR